MKRKLRHRIVIAWLLMMVIMPGYVIKAFHIHEISCESSLHKVTGPHYACSLCYICQFGFSPFTEGRFIYGNSVFRCVVTVITINQETVIYRTEKNLTLRAPPIC